MFFNDGYTFYGTITMCYQLYFYTFIVFIIEFLLKIIYTLFMKENKRARFFCEFCDAEVIGDAIFCSKCGRFFSSVCCPACGLTGEHFLFEHGCPACGYAVDGSPVAMNMTPRGLRHAFQKERATKNKKNRTSKSLPYRTNSPTKRRSDDPLPAWIYIICIVFLGVALMVVFNFLR